MLGKTEAGDAHLRSSREHIIFNALGGPNALVTEDVCKGCNSKLGDGVDADFLKEDIIVVLRQMHSLPGYSGTVPDLDASATSIQTGDTHRMRISSGGPVNFSRNPERTTSIDEQGRTVFHLAGHRDQLQKILSGMQEKYKKKGLFLSEIDGTPITDLDVSIDQAPRVETREFKVRHTLNIENLNRGLVKVAFNFAHFVLGEEWTFGPDGARLRDAVQGKASGADVQAMMLQLDPEFRDHLPLRPPIAGDEHVIILCPSQQLVMVSLLGEPLLSVAVALETSSAALERALLESGKMLVRASPAGGGATWLSYEMLMLALARNLSPR